MHYLRGFRGGGGVRNHPRPALENYKAVGFKLYKAALLTRCNVQHFLSPYIDSEVNHKRHFIKIPFINKGMEFIDLHSIFKDNLVISSIPNYFNNSDTSIIFYKYTEGL